MSENTYPTDDELTDAARNNHAAVLQRELASVTSEKYSATLLDKLKKNEVAAGFAGPMGAEVDIYPGQGGSLPFAQARIGEEDFDVVSTISVMGRDRQDVQPYNPADKIVEATNKSRGTLAMVRHRTTGALSAVPISNEELTAGSFHIPEGDPTRPIHSLSPNEPYGANITVGEGQWDAPAHLTITAGHRGVYTVQLHEAMGAQAVVMQAAHRHDMAQG